MEKVSIIIPVYNVEKYLNKCINSVIAQSFENIDVILVDDGSQDHSPEICDEYARKDDRVTVIHKKNEGLSEARNTGLKRASGKYLLFIDADDYINLDTCSKLFEIAEKNNADIVTGELRNLHGNTIRIMKNYKSDEVILGTEFLKKQFKNKIYRPNVVINLFRREFLIGNSLFFKSGIYHEDEEWTPRVFLKAKRVISSGYCFYNRLIRENSIMTQSSKDKSSKDSIEIAVSMIEEFSDIKNDDLRGYLCDHMISLYFRSVIYQYNYYLKNKNMINKKFPAKYANSAKIKILAYALSIDIRIFKSIWNVKKVLNCIRLNAMTKL